MKKIILYLSILSFQVSGANLENILQTLSRQETSNVIFNTPKNELNIPREVESTQNSIKDEIDTWKVEKNKTLNQLLYLWAKKAEWNLVWNTQYDYSISTNATIHGDFCNAVKQLFLYTGQLNPPIFVSLYEKNRVLKISSNK
ncbi:Toxin co-regulated pilus biosynthesis protein Q [Izhakiella capsodis]|uniref:Toxin co-regulated pilus biosynthesis protein Q n=1 Tax=Izhakiella capsodis TaxID=1367852 RepID=A0A1I4W4Q5_9GAMM|nr:toxin co-regulated pilus biosynthesis Q family protein [Izhakiella capsodis]SFN08463.1 Toxin co-regulated pilus biosynthesis protein Q [Izhakiella capsodis]